MGGAVVITERGYRDSCLGRVLQLKIHGPEFRPLFWSEVWEAFVARYPGRWAVQCFPPTGDLLDGKAVYHLFVLDAEPEGLNLFKG